MFMIFDLGGKGLVALFATLSWSFACFSREEIEIMRWVCALI